MKYCTRCVYPAAAVNVVFDREGVCAACRSAEEFERGASADFWHARARAFAELAERLAARRDRAAQYDCIVPVSGGKDSYWQVHVCRQHGLRPLLVTYHGNNYLPEGQANLDRMRDALGVDHLVFGPSVETLRKLNRAGFRLVGDMNWHAHAGIKIVPLRLAVQLGVPLLVWGEITWTVAGMFDPRDATEYTKRTVLEHDLRGRSWRDMLGGPEGLTEHEMLWLRFPDDADLERVGVRGVYIGNYFPWKPNEHARLMRELYGFEFARQPFERTYRTMSNLDDMHENGLHDYLKFIKFGYGRCSDHASKDVRDGLITREQALELVRRYDHVKPRRDLARWLDYVGMSEEEFDATADTFRDPRVWRIRDGQWWKDTPWGGPEPFGPVHLRDPAMMERYTRDLCPA